jgi:hypothetical protein
MKISIDYDEKSNVFKVQFERALTQTSADAWPPPPPWQNQLQELSDWMIKIYPECLDEFKNPKISVLSYDFTPSPG